MLSFTAESQDIRVRAGESGVLGRQHTCGKKTLAQRAAAGRQSRVRRMLPFSQMIDFLVASFALTVPFSKGLGWDGCVQLDVFRRVAFSRVSNL